MSNVSLSPETAGAGAVPQTSALAKLRIFGIPVHIYLAMLAITLAATYTGALKTDLGGTLVLMMALGYGFGVIGENIPIWKDWIGGGNVMCFMGAAYLVYANILPAKYIKCITAFMEKPFGFLDFFVCMLITGSIISVNRKTLIKALAGYIPAILSGVALAFIFGIGAGLLCGVDIKRVVFMYVLPIMGGGNGAGAVPLSQMWEQITGGSAKEYYSVAIPILTMANIMSVAAAALLNKLGQAKPDLTGNGELMRDTTHSAHNAPKEKVEVTSADIFNGLFLATAFYALSCVVAKAIPNVGGVLIHQYAYMIVLVALANGFGLIPAYMREGAKRMQKGFTDHVIWFFLVGIGVAYTDLGELISVITPLNLFISTVIVLGAAIGPFLFAYLVGFYPIEASISAGLCMADRGGSGDIMVLGAAKRMNLMPYSQISSRLGGGIILVIGSILFSMFGKG